MKVVLEIADLVHEEVVLLLEGEHLALSIVLLFLALDTELGLLPEHLRQQLGVANNLLQSVGELTLLLGSLPQLGDGVRLELVHLLVRLLQLGLDLLLAQLESLHLALGVPQVVLARDESTFKLILLRLQVHLTRVVGLAQMVLLQLLLELLLTLRQLLLNALHLLTQRLMHGVVLEELVDLIPLHQIVLLD